jgi:hypothetical protein
MPKELRISTVVGYLRKLESLLTEPRHATSKAAVNLTVQVQEFISASAAE